MNPFDFTQFEALLLSIDPNASKYEGNGNEAYTVWTPCQCHMHRKERTLATILGLT